MPKGFGVSASPSPPLSTSPYTARVDRSKVDPALVKAAEGMEGMFLDQMIQVMRKTVPENEMSLSSPATKVYQSMLDSEYAEMAAKTGDLGLADLIIAYYDSSGYNQKQGASSSGSARTGGTNEDRTTNGTHEQSFDSGHPKLK